MVRRSVWILVMLLIGLLATTALADSSLSKGIQRASRTCEKGDRAMAQGELAEAQENYLKALKASPEFPPAFLGLGSVAMAEGRYEDALESYKRAKASYITLGKAIHDIELRRFGDVQKQIGMLQDSLDSTVSNSGSNSSEAASGGLVAPSQRGGMNVVDVVAIRNQIARLQAMQPPSNTPIGEAPGQIYFYLGNALFKLGRLEEALGTWLLCAEKSPDFAMVYNNLALVQWKLGDLAAARESLVQAGELGFPVNPKFREDLMRATQ